MGVTYESLGDGLFSEITTTQVPGEEITRRKTIRLSEAEAAIAREIADTETTLPINTRKLSELRTKQSEYAELRGK